MGDLGGGYPIQIITVETKDMTLKWIAVRKQECKSRIARLTQDIGDLKQGKIVSLERDILKAQQELVELAKAEKDV
ncbi:MAG: hypothetical protein KAS32_26595 [Candidatus Peribacteraceae bacterium]|nr:hypothetical protein [Candidatus Peribacteraceae bacterium]